VRLGLVALAIVVGCGGHPPRKREVVRRPYTPVREPYVNPAPPMLRIVRANADALAWPLTSPPSLEPHYRVGFTWPLVCERRGVLPEDVLVYSEAWCAYAKGPQFDLARALVKLRSTTNVPLLPDSIMLDLANLAADGHAHDLPSDATLQEMIIALEIENGQLDDASATAKSYLAFAKGHHASSCGTDLVRWMFDLDPAAVSSLPTQMHMHGSSRCGIQFRRLGCIIWNASGRGPTTECDGVTLDENDRAIARVVTARLRWTPLATPDELVEIGRYAASGMVLSDAEGFAITSFQRALHSSCRVLDDVRKIVKDMDADEHEQERFADARAQLIAMTEQRCLESRVRQMSK
jgi:hypothetical protein